ncbi:MAG TPA: zinc ribbon domain-containing protein [Candidatus Binatia bacterium]
MPIYEYRCPKCGVFDHMQKITEKPLKKCPTCGSGKVSKLMSNPAFHLKGDGWYITDYARKGNGGKGSSSDAGSDSSSDSKSESKKSESATAAA